ncbi:uncharacterized protein LOC143634426 [Bidens hawaiensis]|uniref:uncharacterized protein LOC143634426 n=1 Tax=Bidens hawaiensis TaxID=980011 RepID=UPI00404B5825
MAQEGQKVSLHVYDLSQGLAKQVSSSFWGKPIEGIWHTGVVVYGNEYYLAGGIQITPIGTAPYGPPLRVIDLGVTKVQKDAFESYLKEISPHYTQETYDIWKHNCNNFSNEVVKYLVGTTIPEYIINLPNEVQDSPLAPLMMPLIHNMEDTLREGGVPQGLQFLPSSTKSQPSESKALQPAVDAQGKPRSVVQEEIAKEYAAIRAEGTLGPNEAATLAIKNVMQRYDPLNPPKSC